MEAIPRWTPTESVESEKRPFGQVSYARFTPKAMKVIIESDEILLELRQGYPMTDHARDVIREFLNKDLACSRCGFKGNEFSFERGHMANTVPNFVLYGTNKNGVKIPFTPMNIVPRNYGGPTTMFNLAPVCKPCAISTKKLPSDKVIAEVFDQCNKAQRKELKAKLPRGLTDYLKETSSGAKFFYTGYSLEEGLTLLTQEPLHKRIEVTIDTAAFVGTVDLSLTNVDIFKNIGFTCMGCQAQGLFWKALSFCNTAERYGSLGLFGLDKEGNMLRFTKDHIIPKSHGGPNSIANYQTMCSPCNSDKGNSLPTPESVREVVKNLLATDENFKIETLDTYYQKIMAEGD